jgi:hypothetical protein
MFRMLARWLISRSIDEGRRVPDWLRHWIDRDHDLKQFEKLSRQLGDDLKKDSGGWIASQASAAGEELAGRRRLVVAEPATFRLRHRGAWSLASLSLGTGALAACAWFVVARLQAPPDRAEQPTPDAQRQVVQTPEAVTITAADREWLATTWRTTQANFNQLQARARALPARAEILKLPGVSTIVEPAETAGSTTGRALATLDRGMLWQQQQLADDAKTAFSFFTYRLPASLARLVGWRQ